ncbi:MAG: pyrroline-5-carboxylate reductase [Candidatus Marinimicrobia bacterium]|nr:pyrroline-5-carboxylate reductase [Candidatus Neomarinimicrobiota bacterium]
MSKKVAILGGGNIGVAMAKGFTRSGYLKPDNLIITRRHPEHIKDLEKEGYIITNDNNYAVKNSEIVIVAVRPEQLKSLLDVIKDDVQENKHIIVSVVTGATIDFIKSYLGKKVWVFRVMPNTAVAICESMTTISSIDAPEDVRKKVVTLFSKVGKALEIPEEYIIPATVLCASGIAFFLRVIRAASQGGIEIGFHSDEAIMMAAQTAKGSASILLESKGHPESEIDKVTTPRGITIAGLNEMEHNGISSALIKGIIVSYKKAVELMQNGKK